MTNTVFGNSPLSKGRIEVGFYLNLPQSLLSKEGGFKEIYLTSPRPSPQYQERENFGLPFLISSSPCFKGRIEVGSICYYRRVSDIYFPCHSRRVSDSERGKGIYYFKKLVDSRLRGNDKLNTEIINLSEIYLTSPSPSLNEGGGF